jgi:hypothetical protein
MISVTFHCYFFHTCIRFNIQGGLGAAPAVPSMRLWKFKLDEEKSKHASSLSSGLNKFWPCIFQSMFRLVWGQAKPDDLPEKSVINMIWLLLPVSDSPIIMIRPDGLLLVVPHLFEVPVLVLWVRFGKKVNNQTFMSEIFLQGHIRSTTPSALTRGGKVTWPEVNN